MSIYKMILNVMYSGPTSRRKPAILIIVSGVFPASPNVV